MKRDFSKGSSLALVAAMYAVAVVIGIYAFYLAQRSMPDAWALLVADVIATVVVWGFGLVYENVSVYDPYWSVAPPVMFTAWAIVKGTFSLPVLLLLMAVWCWGIRLTGNWVHTFKGLEHEDWRYTRYRGMLSPFLFHITNFFGLNLVPTLLVFACILPGFRLIEEPGSANWLLWIGFVLCIAAAGIELVADTQIHQFRSDYPGKVCDVGLWRCRRFSFSSASR